jgi:hypothetical protein
LPARIRPGAPAVPFAESADAKKLDEVETQAVLQTLRKNDFNRTATAKALGISRRALIYKLQRLRELGQIVDGPSKNDHSELINNKKKDRYEISIACSTLLAAVRSWPPTRMTSRAPPKTGRGGQL